MIIFLNGWQKEFLCLKNRNSNVGEVSSIFTFSSRFGKNTPKKVQPTNHVTETSFLHVLDPPDHFDTIYIFNHFFTFGLHQIFPKESRVSSIFTFSNRFTKKKLYETKGYLILIFVYKSY